MAVLPTERSISLSRHDDAFHVQPVRFEGSRRTRRDDEFVSLRDKCCAVAPNPARAMLEHPTGASQCDGLLLLGFW